MWQDKNLQQFIGATDLKSVFNQKLSHSFNTNNQLPIGTSSDSESPTEPVTQQTIAMLRAKVVPNKM